MDRNAVEVFSTLQRISLTIRHDMGAAVVYRSLAVTRKRYTIDAKPRKPRAVVDTLQRKREVKSNSFMHIYYLVSLSGMDGEDDAQLLLHRAKPMVPEEYEFCFGLLRHVVFQPELVPVKFNLFIESRPPGRVKQIVLQLLWR